MPCRGFEATRQPAPGCWLSPATPASTSCARELAVDAATPFSWRALLSDEPTVPDASQDIAIADLLARLEPLRRTALVLTQTLGLSYDEAAQVCECPPGTIRSRVARARADLISYLAHASRDRQDNSLGRSSSS